MARRAMVFQRYHSKRLRHLHAKIDLAAEIHNHLIALQKRYYRRFKGYIGYYRLKRHVTKLKRLARFAHWKQLDAQAIQNIVWRIDQGYQKFFRKENKRPPTFRKRSKYHSITLAQTGWRYEGNNRVCGCVGVSIVSISLGTSQEPSKPSPSNACPQGVWKLSSRASLRRSPVSESRRVKPQALISVSRHSSPDTTAMISMLPSH